MANAEGCWYVSESAGTALLDLTRLDSVVFFQSLACIRRQLCRKKRPCAICARAATG